MESGKEKTSSTSQKMIGSGCGIFVAVLFAAPLALIYYLFFSGDGFGGPQAKGVVLLSVCTLAFGFGIIWGIRDAVRRWREISKLQEILGAMTEDEQKEFDDAIVQSDVELCIDKSGKTHSLPLN